MARNNSWKEEVWESFLKDYWDNKDADIVEYTTEDLRPYLSKYKGSGVGEIRLLHSSSQKIEAVKKRNILKIPLSRNSWAIIRNPGKIEFIEPNCGGNFEPKEKLTEGMVVGIKDTMNLSSNPGETTMLAIANRAGIIADFYNLKTPGVLFTGGRQKLGVHLVINNKELDATKAQIEIDGGFEWPQDIVIVEMKSSFGQSDFDTNQALLPMLKWQNLLKDKKAHSLVLLAETNSSGIEYWAYDLVHNGPGVSMKIEKSKKYLINIH